MTHLHSCGDRCVCTEPLAGLCFAERLSALWWEVVNNGRDWRAERAALEAHLLPEIED